MKEQPTEEYLEMVKKVSRKLRTKAFELDLSVRELGKLSGVNTATIYKVMNGEALCGIFQIRQIASVLQISLDNLLDMPIFEHSKELTLLKRISTKDMLNELRDRFD